jgi:hypothetical protein
MEHAKREIQRYDSRVTAVECIVGDECSEWSVNELDRVLRRKARQSGSACGG